MRLLYFLSAVLLGLLLALPTPAGNPVQTFSDGIDGDYWVGYTSNRGYTFGPDNYWHKGGQSYTRALVSYTEYYQYCGRSYPYTAQRVDYTLVNVAPTYTADKVSYTPGWRDNLLRIADANQKSEARLQEQALDHAAFTQSVEAFVAAKLLRPIQANISYPYANQYNAIGYGGTPVLGTYGANGATVYGTQTQQTAYGYNLLDVNLALQSGARLVQNGQQAASQGLSDFHAIVGTATVGDNRVKEINAYRDVGIAAINAAKPQQAITTNTRSFSVGVDPVTGQVPQTNTLTAPVMPHVTDPVVVTPAPTVADVWNTNCAKCHTGPQAKANLTFDVYKALTRQQKIDRVWSRIESQDPLLVMPRGDDGKGHPLSADKKQVFMLDIANSK